ncbi:MAG: hypothetical protein ACK506_16310 [Pirellula sp.]
MSRSKTVSGRLMHLGAWCIANKVKDTEIDYAFVMSVGSMPYYTNPILRVLPEGFVRLAKALKPTVLLKVEKDTMDLSFTNNGVEVKLEIAKERFDKLPDGIRNPLAAIAAANNQAKRLAGVAPLRLTGPGVPS